MTSRTQNRSKAAPRLPFTSTSTTPVSTWSSPELDRLQPNPASRDPDRKNTRRQGNEGSSRPVIPDLNVVTNFSKPSVQVKGVDMTGIAHPEQDSIIHRRQRSRENAIKGAIKDLRRADSKTSELSPSDRILEIGISIPSMMKGLQKQGLVVEPGSGLAEHTTPEIIVTPAAQESPWSIPPDNKSRRRPTSSMYSQATHAPPTYGKDSGSPMPPVPPIPPMPKGSRNLWGHASENRNTTWQDPDVEDDHDRDIARPESRESQHAILGKRASTESIATRHRSKGWWNEIVTPFLDRSNTLMTNHFKSPKLPGVENEAARELSKKNRETGRTSILTDRQRQTLAFFRDDDSDKAFSPPALPTPVLSPEDVQPHGIGEAEEYYNATWHDEHDPTPFYQCQNHECSYGNRNFRKPIATSESGGSQAGEGSRGLEPPLAASNLLALSSTSRDGPGAQDGFQQAPENRFSAAFKSADPKLERQNTDSTQFDEELSATPDLREAKAAPILRAASPVPTINVASAVSPPLEQSHSAPMDPEKSLPTAASAPSNLSNLPTPPLPPIAAAQAAPEPASQVVEERSLPPAPLPPAPVSPIKTAERSLRGPDFESPARAAPDQGISPVLTPGLQHEFSRNNAIPMGQPRFRPQSPLVENEHQPESYDPIQGNGGSQGAFGIDVPRAAPMPPQPVQDSTPFSHPREIGDFASPPPQHQDSIPNGLGSYPTHSVNQYFAPGEEKPMPAPYGYPPPAVYYPPPPPEASHSNYARSLDEPEAAKEKVPKGPGLISRLYTKWKASRTPKTKEQKKRRCLFLSIFFALLGIVVLILSLVLTLHRPHTDIPVQSSWLNLTNFPPIPTGIATVVRPNSKADSSCIAPTSMWSCALPKEEQASIAPNAPDQPNFRVEIRFQNGTNLTNSSSFSHPTNSSSSTSSLTARAYYQRQLLRARDSFTNSLFSPSPKPPSDQEQSFLGNTTDSNSFPFNGEATPFFISFLPADPTPSSRRLTKRASNTTSTSSTSSSSASGSASAAASALASAIPSPAVNPDGTAAAATLLPFPSAQPLRLYDRGKATEHYGFYSYFDRSIFLRSADISNISSLGHVPDNDNGGAEENSASVRCTWPQTRFLVQIWTNTAGTGAQLLGNATSNGTASSTPTSTSTSTSTSQFTSTSTGTSDSSANDFTPPGSFQYPITITIDRHGGDVDKKSLYCYGMDESEHIINSDKQFQIEDRAAGGALVNPALGLFGGVNVTEAEGGPGGIDGGTGGCGCQWKNFGGA